LKATSIGNDYYLCINDYDLYINTDFPVFILTCFYDDSTRASSARRERLRRLRRRRGSAKRRRRGSAKRRRRRGSAKRRRRGRSFFGLKGLSPGSRVLD
jgi:hypothetical protein